MLPPESAEAENVAGEIAIGADTLKRWFSEVLAARSREPPGRLWRGSRAVLTTAAMDETATVRIHWGMTKQHRDAAAASAAWRAIGMRGRRAVAPPSLM
jgi:hypothetical protein